MDQVNPGGPDPLDPQHLARVVANLGALPEDRGALRPPTSDLETTRVALPAEITRLAQSTATRELPAEARAAAPAVAPPTTPEPVGSERPPEVFITVAGGTLPLPRPMPPEGLSGVFATVPLGARPPEVFVTVPGGALPVVPPPVPPEGGFSGVFATVPAGARPPEAFVTVPGAVLPTGAMPASPDPTRNSLTVQEAELRPSFPGEAYTDLLVRNPSLEQTLVEPELIAARLRPPAPDSPRTSPAAETRVLRSPIAARKRWVLAASLACVAVLGAGTVLALRGHPAPPAAPPTSTEVHSPPAPAEKPPAPRSRSQRASIRIATSLPAAIRIDGTFFGNSPVELKDLPAEELRVEISNPELGFRKVVRLELEPGNNGTKEIAISRFAVELHIKPRAFVTIDGTQLGEMESTRLELYEGWHRIQAVDRRGRRTLNENFIVLPDQANRFSYDLTR